nr:hypothetical protein [Tanacetum cinerariifolium]
MRNLVFADLRRIRMTKEQRIIPKSFNIDNTIRVHRFALGLQVTLKLLQSSQQWLLFSSGSGNFLYWQWELLLCLTAGGNTFLELRDNIQGYVAVAAANYNQENSSYPPSGVANQIRPPDQSYQAPTQQNQVVPLSELEKIKRVNEANMKAMQTQINNMKNELRNEMKNSIQASISNQTNELKNMMASFLQMNNASTTGSGSLPSNTIANSKGELKAITTQSGIFLDGPFVLIPPPFINPEEDERVEETLTNQDLAEYTIKVPSPLIQKPKPPSQKNFVVHQRDPLHPNIPYPSRMLKQKHQEKDEEKLLELANRPLNVNFSAVILKKLLEKLRDPGKFLIPCGFSELKCKALADLCASIKLIPLSVWKKLGLPELISTRMTLELANRAICTPDGIARDVFVPVGKFTFPVDFVIVYYKSDPRVPLILGRPFFRIARALIDVHGEEMILRDEVKDDVFDPVGGDVLSKEFLDLDSTKDLHPPHNVNPLKIEYLLHHDPNKDMDSSLKDPIDQSKLDDLNDNLVDTIPEMFTEEHALDYSSPSLYDEYDDDLFQVKSDTEYVYDDPFDSKGEKTKESKLLIDELDLPKVPTSKTLLSFSSENEEKVFKPEILTSKEVHSSLIPERSHQGYKVFKISQILKSPMEIFLLSHGEDIHILDDPYLHFYSP